MGEPTVEDAIRLLTDPGNRVWRGGRPTGGMVQMRPPATIGELQAMGVTLERARVLVDEAARTLGGWHRVELHRGGMLPGRRPGHEEDEIWIPLKALRQP